MKKGLILWSAIVFAVAMYGQSAQTPTDAAATTVQAEQVDTDIPGAKKAKKGCCAAKAGNGQSGCQKDQARQSSAKPHCGAKAAGRGKGCCAGHKAMMQQQGNRKGEE